MVNRTREQILIAFIGVTVLALVFFVAGTTSKSNVPIDCFDPTERERVRELAIIAIDKGFEQAAMHLYTVWQKDPDSDQPKRARVGMTNALNAHARARKFAIAWAPPTCP